MATKRLTAVISSTCLLLVATGAGNAATGPAVPAPAGEPAARTVVTPGSPPPLEVAPYEPGRAVAQFGLGAAVSFGGLLLFLAGSRADDGGKWIPSVILLATPAAVGLTVCGVGDGGAYQGSCTISTLSAYAVGLGTITALVTLTFGGAFSHRYTGEEEQSALLAGLIAWIPGVS